MKEEKTAEKIENISISLRRMYLNHKTLTIAEYY